VGQENVSRETPMICEVLAQLNDANLLSPKDVSRILKVSRSSSHRYFNDTDPGWTGVSLIFRDCSSIPAQRAILNDLLDVTPWHAFPMIARLDARDGILDTSAVIDGTITALGKTQDALNAARAAEKMGLPRMSEGDACVLKAHLRQAMEALAGVEHVVNLLTVKEPAGA